MSVFVDYLYHDGLQSAVFVLRPNPADAIIDFRLNLVGVNPSSPHELTLLHNGRVLRVAESVASDPECDAYITHGEKGQLLVRVPILRGDLLWLQDWRQLQQCQAAAARVAIHSRGGLL
jgi:hypothetical protein